MTKPLPDTRLSMIARLKSGETRKIGLEQFHDRYQGVIRGFALRCGVSAQDAEAIVSDVLTGFISRLDGFTYEPDKGGLRRYLFVCTRHSVVAHWTAQARWSTHREDSGRGGLTENTDSEQYEAWNEAWERALIPRAMKRLEEEWDSTESSRRDYRIANKLIMEARTVDALAAEFGVSRNVVYKAREAAKAELLRMIHELDPLDL